MAGKSALSMLQNEHSRAAYRSQALAEQAQYLVGEIGKLKGSVVKLGQMLALYGEHFLPAEVTASLHQLNDSSTPLSWQAISKGLPVHVLQDISIEQTPIGAASLAQVHRGTIKATGEQVVLKIQYPGVADAIDSDLALFKSLLGLFKVIPQTAELETWFVELQEMLTQEVDYAQEAHNMAMFAGFLQGDTRYAVPRVYSQYCSMQVLCMSYHHGVALNSAEVLALPKSRRDALGEAVLEIAMREITQWGYMQTDPNFGNYLVQINPDPHGADQLVLLDFGAIRGFDDNLLAIAKNLLKAGQAQNAAQMTAAMVNYSFFDLMPSAVKERIAKVFVLASMPFAPKHQLSQAAELLDPQGRFKWRDSNLHARVMQQLTDSMLSTSLSVPPKEAVFISRKFIGVYTCLTVLDAYTHSETMANKYLGGATPPPIEN